MKRALVKYINTTCVFCLISTLALALFSTCAFAVSPQQDARSNSNAFVVSDSNNIQVKASRTNDFLNDLCADRISNSSTASLFFNHDNWSNQDSKTTVMSANDQPITLNVAANSNVIGYIQYTNKSVDYTNAKDFVNAINKASDAHVYLCKNVTISVPINIKWDAKITIHLCGHVLSGGNIAWPRSNEQVILVSSNANLTIIGSENDTQANQTHTLNGFDVNGEMKTYSNICGGVINAGHEDDVIGIRIGGVNAKVTLENTTIFGCSDKEAGGGGINIDNNGIKLYLVNSCIQHCRADSGGAIYLTCRANNSYISMINSSIDHNHADDYGGGFFCNAENVTIEDMGYKLGDENTRSTISYNKADDDAGAIYSNRTGLIVNGFSFRYNRADRGGAVCVNDTYNSINGCTFICNKAESGGGIHINMFDNHTCISSCSFYNNQVDENGGGVYIKSENNILDRCIFVGNISEKSGSAIVDINDNNILRDCTIRGNTSKSNAGAVYVCDDCYEPDSTYGSAANTNVKLEGNMYISNNIGNDVFLNRQACIYMDPNMFDRTSSVGILFSDYKFHPQFTQVITTKDKYSKELLKKYLPCFFCNVSEYVLDVKRSQNETIDLECNGLLFYRQENDI